MIYNSNLDKVLNDLKARVLSPDNLDKLCGEVALSLYASNQKRIITEGLDVDGRSIGQYSTKPIYINPSRSPVRFTPKTKVKKKPLTRYFSGGYKEFRGFVGRVNDRVNVDLTHRLKTDYKIFHVASGHYQIGFASDYGKQVSDGNEAHFKTKIWGIAVSDRRLIETIVKGFLKRIK